MPRLVTHYDNLKISRNAPPEIIRAAYKALAQKYHPDKCEDKDNSARIMAVINEAYEVLSDPERREVHDKWIEQKEAETAAKNDSNDYKYTKNENEEKAPEKIKKKVPFVTMIICIFLLSKAAIFLKNNYSKENKQKIATAEIKNTNSYPGYKETEKDKTLGYEDWFLKYSKWTKVSDDENSDIYIDTNTIIPMPDKTFMHWYLINMKKEKITEKDGISSASWVKINCRDETYKIVTMVIFNDHMARGKVVDVISPDKEFEKIPEGHMFSAAYQGYCPKLMSE